MNSETVLILLSLANIFVVGLLAWYALHNERVSGWWYGALGALLLLAVVDLVAALQHPSWGLALTTAAADVILIAIIAIVIRRNIKLDTVHTHDAATHVRDSSELASQRDDRARALRDHCDERF